MRLCDRDIEMWLNEGRLFIKPRPSMERINGVTVDVHLGNKFRTFNSHTDPFIDLNGPKNRINDVLDRIMSDEILIDEGKAFYLHPGALALGATFESVELPADLVGWLDGRSSLGRLGLMVHITAHRIDPGWSGCIVLEFFNAGKVPLVLRPGMIIGALSFEPLTGPADRPYNRRQNAKYFDQKGVVVSRLDKE